VVHAVVVGIVTKGQIVLVGPEQPMTAGDANEPACEAAGQRELDEAGERAGKRWARRHCTFRLPPRAARSSGDPRVMMRALAPGKIPVCRGRSLDRRFVAGCNALPGGSGNARALLMADLPGTAAELARMIDHTLLSPSATAQDIDRLCAEAAGRRLLSVCVNPCWVGRAKRALAGSDVSVCTVVGFPLGANASATKVHETRLAVEHGADEIDMVMNVGWLLGGRED